MFDLGFSEILFIAIIALLFIGPDKLPETLKNIARTIGKIKRSFEDVKESVNNELRVNELRDEVLSYKRELEKAKEDLSAFKNVASREIGEIKESVASQRSFKPNDINSDAFLDDWERAEKEFDKLEKGGKSGDKIENRETSARQEIATTKEPKDSKDGNENRVKDLAQELTDHFKESTVAEFKHLKRRG
jgi:sec-independent protein translocase protein TatB